MSSSAAQETPDVVLRAIITMGENGIVVMHLGSQGIAEVPEGGDDGMRWRLGVLVLAALLVSGLFQARRGLYEPTETRYVECARETLRTGDVDDPVLNGKEHWTKPPMTYMAIMLGLKLFGHNTWGGRFFLVPAFVALVAGVWLLGTLLRDEGVGTLAALVVLSSPICLVASNFVCTDLLLTMWMTWVWVFFWYAMRSGSRWGVLGMWVMLALAVLTKGHVAFLSLAGVLPAYHALRREGGTPVSIYDPFGFLLFVVVGIGWYGVELYEHPVLASVWLFELWTRSVSSSAHRWPKWYHAFVVYGPTLFFGLGAWSVVWLWCRRRSGWCFSSFEHPAAVFLRWGVGLPLLIFMVCKSRLPLYLLPLFPLLAVWLGARLDAAIRESVLKPVHVAAVVMITLCVFLPLKWLSPVLYIHKDMAVLSGAVTAWCRSHSFPAERLLVYGKPLNGLEYYLGRRIPNVPIESGLARGGLPQELLRSGCFGLVLESMYVERVAREASARGWRVRESAALGDTPYSIMVLERRMLVSEPPH